MADKFNFDQVIKNLERTKSDLPKVIAAKTKKHFLDNFANESFEDERWPDVQRHKRKSGSSRNQSKTLIQSGALRRAAANSLALATWVKIKFIISDVRYAAVHNYGLRAGRGAGFIMPKRKFIGDSPQLRKLQLAEIKKGINKIWKTA